MGIFDFIFGKKKKEEEARLEREHQERLKQEQEEKARKERKHQEELKREREEIARKERVSKAIQNGTPVKLLVFHTTWCGPSKRLLQDFGKAGLKYSVIDVEKEQDMGEKYKIRNVPTTILVNEQGEILNKWIGYDDEDPGQTKIINYLRQFGNQIVDGGVKGNNQVPSEQDATSVKPFVFKSDCHQRYENGTPKLGLQECIRTIRVEKNTNGCSGYRLAPGVGYIVKIYNDDLGKPNMSDKPMKVVRQSNGILELRGFPIDAQTPFGWQEIDLSEYGLVVYYENGKVVKCRLHMYDRNTYIEYLSRNNENYNEQDFRASHSPIKKDVDTIIKTYEDGNISLLQQRLFELYGKLNKPGSGKLVTTYPEKDRLCEYFTLCLQYDWMNDSDIREVWAEDAFYCITDYYLNDAKTKQDHFAAGLDLLWVLYSGKDGLVTKFNDVLQRAQFHPVHSLLFSPENYNGGAYHLIREFTWFAANEVRPVEAVHPEILKGKLRQEYENALNNKEFQNTSNGNTLLKMKLLSSIIGSILEDF